MTLIENMELNAGADELWDRLVERGGALRLLPGAVVTKDGRGTLKVILGGHSITYRGYARQHLDEPGRRVTWTLSGREVRGSGRGHLEVRARLREVAPGRTDLRLTVLVDGRGRLDEVNSEAKDHTISQAIARFRRALEAELPAGRAQPPEVPPATARTAQPTDPGIPELEIVPPRPTSRSREMRSVAFVLGGLLLGSLVATLWRWRRNAH